MDSQTRNDIAEEILADSARLPRGSLAGFKEDDREVEDWQAGAKKKDKEENVVEGITEAFRGSKRRSSSKTQSLEGYNEALGVSNLGMDALADVHAPDAHIRSLGKDIAGLAQDRVQAQEALNKTDKGSRASRRKSDGSEGTSKASKVSKVKKSALHAAKNDLMPTLGMGEKPSNARMEGDRCLVKMSGPGGEDRPIRMDTREGYAPKLNGLIDEIRKTRIHAHNREHNRVEKIRSLNKEIMGLRYKRAEYSLDSANWQSDNWRWVNTHRARANPKEMLHDCAPSKRISALRSIEVGCMAAVMEGTRPPSPARRPPAIRAWM